MVAILQPTKQGRVIPIDRAVVLVGRGSDCDAAIRGSQKISRRHCCLVQVDDNYYVRDLGSMNGVWLNGDRVEREAILNAGDTLCIGDVEFLFHPNARIETRRPQLENAMPLPPTSPPEPAPPIADDDAVQPAAAEDQEIPLSESPEVIDDVIPLDELHLLEEGDGPDEQEDVLVETNEYEIIDEPLELSDDDDFEDRIQLDG
jgi:pSer/pThr/pTyr-binding forkhead associated (FHA) protein